MLWSPNNREFVVNDWIGSCEVRAYLYRINDLSHPIDVGNELLNRRKTDKVVKKAFDANLDRILYASRWLSPNVVKIELSTLDVESGRAPLTGLELTYLWDLKKKSFKCIKRAGNN